MGWVLAGNVQIYSFADTITSFTDTIFSWGIILFSPFVLTIFLLFMISIIAYTFLIISKKMKESVN